MLNWMMNCFNRWITPRALGGSPLLSAAKTSTAGPQPEAEAQPDVTAEPPPLDHEDLKRAGKVISHVSELTTAVATDVGQHQCDIESINLELSGISQGDTGAVTALVGKLLAANQELKTRLERAELKLQAHSRQLQDVTIAARTDSLTGLMNRRALDEELRRSLAELSRRGRSAALLLLDVDHFKRFNDTHGHVAGDEALKYVADSLRAQSRETDIVARFGGEEFAVIFAATTAAAVRRRAEEVRAAIGRSRITVEGQQVVLTASAGLAENQPGEEISQWLKRADAALYSAKNDGRNCAFWYAPSGLARIDAEPSRTPAEPESTSPVAKAPRSAPEASAQLAPDAFADTTFVRQIGQRIAEWRRGGATFSLLLARLDGMRSNEADEESFSSPQAIQTVLQLARGCLREMDVLTRWNSDGIAMLLPGAGVAETRVVARRLHAALAKHETDEGEPMGELTICTGIAEGIEGNDANRVLQRAWLALEAAQAAGSGMIFVHDGLKALPINPPLLAR